MQRVSPYETICMKYQILFSKEKKKRKKKEINFKMSSAETFTQHAKR